MPAFGRVEHAPHAAERLGRGQAERFVEQHPAVDFLAFGAAHAFFLARRLGAGFSGGGGFMSAATLGSRKARSMRSA